MRKQGAVSAVQLTFEGLFDVAQVAAITRLSRGTVRRYCRQGCVEFSTMPGGEYRFSDNQVAGFLKLHPLPTNRRITRRGSRGVRA